MSSTPPSSLVPQAEGEQTATIPIGSLSLEIGTSLEEVHLHTWVYGSWPPAGPVAWIVHALTGRAEVPTWWAGVWDLTGLSRLPLTVISVNLIGSCYGSTGPLSVNPVTARPYFRSFPLLTTRDAARSLEILRESLGVSRIDMLIGASLGAQVGLEWLLLAPERFQMAVLIAGNAFHSPWGIAFNEAQRMAIFSDPTYYEDRPDGGATGMRAARAMAMLSYRSYELYGSRLAHPENFPPDALPAVSYQQHQGQKLAQRFNAYTYVVLSRMMDSHHIARSHGLSVEQVLATLPMPVVYVGIPSDILYPLSEQAFLANHTPLGKLEVLDSPCGHDAFLIEEEKMAAILLPYLTALCAKKSSFSAWAM
ncbi:MAG: alpha/beta fold hydrolase [Bacteroidia bacterium]|nr:alpha/beta fold hydrolase [Bacteroidia bacterium]